MPPSICIANYPELQAQWPTKKDEPNSNKPKGEEKTT